MERTRVLSNTSTDYTELNNSQNVNQEFDTISNQLDEYPFSWTNITVDISISSILAFCIFFLISEVHEIAHNAKIGSMRIFNNAVESAYLFGVFLAMMFHLNVYRNYRNFWYSIMFDNYPMLIMMCIYGLIEMLYYTLNYIGIFTSCYETSRPICTTAELMFMACLLPFAIFTVKKNVRKAEIWLKMKTKITIMLAMVGCMVIFSRKIAIKFKKDYTNYTVSDETCTYTRTADVIAIHEICSSILNILEIIDINYFIIGFVLLLNPLFNLDKHNETMVTGDDSIEISNTVQFSIWVWISLVRKRLVTVLLSVAIVSIMAVSIYLTVNILTDGSLSMDTKYTTMTIFLSVVTCGYIITIVYGIYYYFADIRLWESKDKHGLNSDQYFNYMTASSQLIYSCTMLIGQLAILGSGEYPSGTLLVSQIVNYFFLSIQVLIQGNCIHSASRRTIRQFTNDEIGTWNYKLIPPMILAAFNFIAMIVSIVYTKYPIFSQLIQEKNSEELLWLLMKDLTLPLTILNRFHGMTFFLNLTLKQWHHTQ